MCHKIRHFPDLGFLTTHRHDATQKVVVDACADMRASQLPPQSLKDKINNAK